jgi:hypothetical protein
MLEPISDLAGWQHRPSPYKILQSHDYATLNDCLFPTPSQDDGGKLFKYLSQTKPTPRESQGQYLGYGKAELSLGHYEAYLVERLTNSQEPVMCIVGHMGSGKSCTIRYIKSVLEQAPCHACGTRSPCKHRKHIIFDFNTAGYPGGEEQARRAIARDIADRLQAALEDSEQMSPEEETVHFWKEMFITLMSSGYILPTFTEIKNELSKRKREANQPDLPLDLAARLKIRDKVLRDPHKAMEYYLQLWRYVTREKFGGRQERAVLFFDNIDHAEPSVQAAFVWTLMRHAARSGARCVIAIRPETYAGNNMNGASAIIEKIDQQGPDPAQVVCFHMNRFVEDASLYADVLSSFEPARLTWLRDYFRRVLELNGAGSKVPGLLTEFFGQVCGTSIRLGMELGRCFLRIDGQMLWDVNANSLNVFDVKRALIRHGMGPLGTPVAEQMNLYPIENLFDVASLAETGRFLVKPRILRFLSRMGPGGARLNELRETMRLFGYAELDLLFPALSELMWVKRRLVRSTIKDRIESGNQFYAAGEMQLTLSPIGAGYVKLMGDLDYIEAAMFHSRVEIGTLPRGDVSSTSGILLLLFRFLDLLYREDVREIQEVLVAFDGYERYRSRFGVDPVSWQIVSEAYRSMRRIINSELRKEPHGSEEHQKLLDVSGRIDGLLDEIVAFSEETLGVRLARPAEYELDRAERIAERAERAKTVRSAN